MTCDRFEALLEEMTEGRLPADLARLAEEHAAGCAACRDLAALALAAEPIDPGATLAADVLARTSGPACEAACDRLGDLVDGLLAGRDRELVELHLRGCPECDSIRASMLWLSTRLAPMAEISPDARFLGDVLNATSARRAEGAGRLRLWWARLAQRPRFALEAAYVAALVVWLLTGTPASPLRGMPRQALELARVNPIELLEDSVQPAALGRQVWSATGSRVVRRADEASERAAGRLAPVAGRTGLLGLHAKQMVGALLSGNLSEGAARLEEVSADVKGIWNELTGTAAPIDPNAQQT